MKGLTKIAKFSHFLRHLVNFPQFCTGLQILHRVADSAQNSARAESQNPGIPTLIIRGGTLQIFLGYDCPSFHHGFKF